LAQKIAKDSNYQVLCWGAVAITLALTPWMNSDSLIIPKVIILVSLALYLLPKLFFFKYYLVFNRITKLFVSVLFLIAAQMILVMWNSQAPFEQQFFGRTGRGLGLITEISLLVLVLTASISAKSENIKTLMFTLTLSCTITSAYSVLQRFGLDIFEWVSRTNGIIGTLGNPNFQSSFAAMCLIPSLIYVFNRRSFAYGVISLTALITLIYFSQSTQGYVLAVIVILVFLIVRTYYRYRVIFFILIPMTFFTGLVIIAGMTNRGLLAKYLYKTSVQSRGDFYETTLSIANSNPLFGVGLDSLGDHYLMYRSESVAKGINEFTDSAHNYFLNYASTGGYPLAILNLMFVLLVLYNFLILFRRSKVYEPYLTALFCIWICFQFQALISPSSIPLLVWNAIISGTIIGLVNRGSASTTKSVNQYQYKLGLTRPFSYLLLIIGLIIVYPYFNVDRMQIQANKTGDALLALKSAKSYPESTVRYSRIGQALIDSNLAVQSLDLARSAVAFNPNAPSAWAMLLLNNSATYDERVRAREEVLRLDPFNEEVRAFVVPQGN